MPDWMEKVWAQSDQYDPRKIPKTFENLLFWQVITNYQYFGTFGCFLRTGWSNGAQTFSIDSGISIQKFRVPTRSTLKHFEISIFLTLTPLEGTLGKIFLTRKLHFRYSNVIEHLLKHLQKMFSTKRGEWHTLLSAVIMK